MCGQYTLKKMQSQRTTNMYKITSHCLLVTNDPLSHTLSQIHSIPQIQLALTYVYVIYTCIHKYIHIFRMKINLSFSIHS